ncbi:MAG: hypothetical protein ABSC17_07545, partial [Thermacetogeniaceae bacterium]
IMGIRHREYLVEGVQFHPESILTEEGKPLLWNFVNRAGLFWQSRRPAQVERDLASGQTASFA